MNKDDLEAMLDELGLKTVLALISRICLEKAERAKLTQGYYSDPCRKYLQASSRIKSLLPRIEVDRGESL